MMDYLLFPLETKLPKKIKVRHLFILSDTKFMISETCFTEDNRNVFDVGNIEEYDDGDE